MTTYRWSFDEDVTNFRAAGISGIGVWRRKLAEFGEERGIDMLRESGLTISSLSCAGGFTGSDGQTFREAVDDALEALRLAADMRAECLIVVTGARSGHTSNHARRLVSEALSELGDLGQDLGVHVAVQPMHRQPAERCSFLTSLDATLALLERCGHPHVGMVFDLHHHFRQEGIAGRLGQVAGWTKLVTLSEPGIPTKPGATTSQELDLKGLVESFASGGFRGWYDLQVLCENSWKSDYHELIARWRGELHSDCPEYFPGNAVSNTAAQPLGPSAENAPVHRR
jgi:sugar phosphate isomerase/epimerase